MLVHLLVLNFNGRRLLEECLPSVVDAARASRHPCDVAVVDNDSTDDSVAWLAGQFPEVRVIRRPNRGLSSFNDVVPGLEGPVAVLLNNDVKLDAHCIDPLVAPLLDPQPHGGSPCFMTAPLCWLFDGVTYEGFKTAVSWRWGLVRASALFPGHEAQVHNPGLTASAGSALAVDCWKFAALGGFDPVFLPGRLEDLDFAFRGYMAGWHARYVPAAVAYHRGMATFGAVFGRSGCDQLALRNTLLFQWKNLRHPAHLARALVGLPIRLVFDVVRAPWVPPAQRWAFARALAAALARWGQLRSSTYRARGTIRREREFFRRFHPRSVVRALRGEMRTTSVRASTSSPLPLAGEGSLGCTPKLRWRGSKDDFRVASPAVPSSLPRWPGAGERLFHGRSDARTAATGPRGSTLSTTTDNVSARDRATAARRSPPVPSGVLEEGLRARRYPISRWYLRPAAGWLAAVLTPTRVRPVHLTAFGFAVGCVGVVVLMWRPELSPLAAAFVLAAWFFDRADGQLARRQKTVSAWGAWLDANVDEALDVAAHVALAAAGASRTASSAPWLLLVAFLAGKYLFMHGLASEEHVAGETLVSPEKGPGAGRASPGGRLLYAIYHLPANADVRVHLLAAALVTGWFSAELAVVAAYYNVRWIARYVLVVRRLGGSE